MATKQPNTFGTVKKKVKVTSYTSKELIADLRADVLDLQQRVAELEKLLKKR